MQCRGFKLCSLRFEESRHSQPSTEEQGYGISQINIEAHAMRNEYKIMLNLMS